MEITLVNMIEGNDLIDYQEDFSALALILKEKLHLKNQMEASVIFLDDYDMLELNKKYRNIAETTDVLSFALKDEDDGYEVGEEVSNCLGDIFISIPTAKKQAYEYGHDLKRELRFLFIHGLLHLLGYSHENQENEEEMFSLQKEILNSYEK